MIHLLGQAGFAPDQIGEMTIGQLSMLLTDAKDKPDGLVHFDSHAAYTRWHKQREQA